MRKKLFIAGGVIAAIWAAITIYLAVTAEGMEILKALVVFLIGGYAIGIYLLFVNAITSKTKKGKIIAFSFFILWLLIPVINYAQNELENFLYQRKLESTAPSKELIEEAFSHIDNPYITLTGDFYTYQEQQLTIKVDVLEEAFIEHASSQYKSVENEMKERNGEVDQEELQEYMVEDVFARYLFNVHSLHSLIWNRTSEPRKITVDLDFNDELIYHTTSTKQHDIKGANHFVEQVEQFYNSKKTDIINE